MDVLVKSRKKITEVGLIVQAEVVDNIQKKEYINGRLLKMDKKIE